jgi:phosphatidate cytidylyltransferase
MKDLARRASVSSCLITVLALLIFFALNPWVSYIVAIATALLTATAVWEYGQLAMAKGGQMILPVLITAAVIQVLSFFYAATLNFSALPLFVFFIAILLLFALHFRENKGAVVDLAVSSFGLLYIAIPMGMLLGVLYVNGGEDGRWWLAYLLVVTKISDVGAYFGGNLWGKRKLAPTISPGKTVEGAIAGLICAGLASYAFHFLGNSLNLVGFHLGALEWICLGLVLGLVGQFGDLSESLLKRDANKKDSNSLPGLGGALDLIDSLLFNAAIIYFYLNYFKV